MRRFEKRARAGGSTRRPWLAGGRRALVAITIALWLGWPTTIEMSREPAEPERQPARDVPASATPAGQPGEIAVAGKPDVVVTVDRQRPAGASQLAIGATLTQYSLNPWGDAGAIARGKQLLGRIAIYENQHIMGWGGVNPEPAPGVYDWSSLDQRVRLMREIGATPTITLCCALDWMKGGQPGATDWSQLTKAPLPEHYDDFAELARQVALRYPDVKHYLVWNEMKGFWSSRLNNWDYRRYTTLYNKVYDALKSVSPDIKVGGPYLVIEGTGSETGQWWSVRPISQRNRSVLKYWLEHKRGADFLVVDRPVKSAQDVNRYSAAEYLGFTPLFGQIVRQLREMSDLPIWWAESYFVRDDANPDFEAAGLASMLYHQLRAGSSVSLCWSPEARPGGRGGQRMFSDTLAPGGGQPLPALGVYQAFRDYFPPGTRLYRADSSSPDVEALASSGRVLLINKRPDALLVQVNHARVSLKGYGVSVVAL